MFAYNFRNWQDKYRLALIPEEGLNYSDSVIAPHNEQGTPFVTLTDNYRDNIDPEQDNEIENHFYERDPDLFYRVIHLLNQHFKPYEHHNILGRKRADIDQRDSSLDIITDSDPHLMHLFPGSDTLTQDMRQMRTNVISPESTLELRHHNTLLRSIHEHMPDIIGHFISGQILNRLLQGQEKVKNDINFNKHLTHLPLLDEYKDQYPDEEAILHFKNDLHHYIAEKHKEYMDKNVQKHLNYPTEDPLDVYHAEEPIQFDNDILDEYNKGHSKFDDLIKDHFNWSRS